MLELGPTCERCNRALPPDSLEARISAAVQSVPPRER